MYAVIETGGKQYRVSEGDVICIEKLPVEAQEKVVFDKVLAIGEGENIEIGTPYVDGKQVYGFVVENGKGKKVIIFKYKSKKDYRKKQGHRQPYTMVEISGIGTDKPRRQAEEPAVKAAEGEKFAEAADTAAESAKKPSLSMKKDELIAYAKENNIEIDEKATKQVILDAIESASK